MAVSENNNSLLALATLDKVLAVAIMAIITIKSMLPSTVVYDFLLHMSVYLSCKATSSKWIFVCT